MIFFGDFDAKKSGAQTYQRLLEEVRNRDISEKMIFHLGDIAYDLEEDGGMRGDIYFDKMQEIIAQIPYMFTYGNHEKTDNYTNSMERFRMP